MDKLLEALRRNPDAIAIAVLCLTLGVGRCRVQARAAAFHRTAPSGIHWIWNPDGDAPDVHTQWNGCLPALPSLPEIGR
jgi:hypothetical protein